MNEPVSCAARPERTLEPAGRLLSRRCLGCAHRNAAAILADALEDHRAGDQREEAVIARLADARARHDAGPALADDDRARGDRLTPVGLDTEALRVGVTAVARRAAALLVRHLS